MFGALTAGAVVSSPKCPMPRAYARPQEIFSASVTDPAALAAAFRT